MNNRTLYVTRELRAPDMDVHNAWCKSFCVLGVVSAMCDRCDCSVGAMQLHVIVSVIIIIIIIIIIIVVTPHA
eukprot:5732494-Amphidinium_carterae.1